MSEPSLPEPLPEPTYDPDTLLESYPGVDVEARVEQLRADLRAADDDIAELLSRGDLVLLLCADGQLDTALDEANAAADRAEIVGTAAQQHLARLRLAHVHQRRGEFTQSNPLLTELLAAADQFGPVVEAFTQHYAGLNDFGQKHWSDARSRFHRAVQLRESLELDEAASSRVGLLAATRRVAGS